jgi:prepilin-type N-terminal cleavage/methylation domain-containing protein
MISFLKGAGDQRGFTLIELIVAMTILAIIIAPTLGLFSATFKNNRHTKEKLVALALAQGEIEELKAMDFQRLLQRVGESTKKLPAEDGTVYTVQRDIELLDDEDDEPKLLKITVTVSWTGGEVSFSTVKGDIVYGEI